MPKLTTLKSFGLSQIRCIALSNIPNHTRNMQPLTNHIPPGFVTGRWVRWQKYELAESESIILCFKVLTVNAKVICWERERTEGSTNWQLEKTREIDNDWYTWKDKPAIKCLLLHVLKKKYFKFGQISMNSRTYHPWRRLIRITWPRKSVRIWHHQHLYNYIYYYI